MASSRELRELVVLGLGAVTSIGPTVASAASAFRAGIVRSHPLRHFTGFDGDTEGNPITGRPVTGFTDGFAQFGLWLRLALGALDDLRCQLDADADQPSAWQGTALIACLPALTPERFALPTDDVAGLLREAFLDPLQQIAGLSFAQPHVHTCFGHCGAGQAVHLARQLLAAEPKLERVLLVGSDSTIDAQSLGWLADQGRLKTAENPVGLIPGEAGIAVLVEPPRSAHGGRPLGRLSPATISAGLGPEAANIDLGRQLGATVQEALRSADLTTGADLYVDLNGETWRTECWGIALTCMQKALGNHDLRTVIPGTSFGETGAASGLLALALATRAFVRGHARSKTAAVVSVDELRATSAFLVSGA